MKIFSEKTKEYINNQELIFHYIKSSGPWWQNVNKRNTKVQIFFDINKSNILTEEQKEVLKQYYPEGMVIITSHEERFQKQNKENALKKLREILEKYLTPQKKRKSTKVPASQKEKRYLDKTRQWLKKKGRSWKISLDNEE